MQEKPLLLCCAKKAATARFLDFAQVHKEARGMAPTEIPVSRFLEPEAKELKLTLVVGKAGLWRPIANPRIQKPGLALTGLEVLHHSRVQIFGNTELSYLKTLRAAEQEKALQILWKAKVSCIVVTKGLSIPASLQRGCSKARLPLFKTPLQSSQFIMQVQSFLEEALSATGSIHGVLLDIYGVGVLLLGESGIGKSELALDLVSLGHRLVADDMVFLRRRREGSVYGHVSERLMHHIEIRGLGIINIKDLFGVSSVRPRKKIDLIIELKEWGNDNSFDRLGTEEKTRRLLGISLPEVALPVRTGRNLSTIIEVAARNHLLKVQGHHSARKFVHNLRKRILSPKPPPNALDSADEEPIV